MESKPCWIDRHGNGWARPNINAGASYHWDVYINNPNHVALVGLNQVNVVQFGAPAGEGKAGWIHHVPGDKAGKINLEKRGWSCE